MSYFEIILLALALSIDACVVSFTYGLCYNVQRIKNSLSLAVFTGAFQALMPVLGYYITELVKDFISPFSSVIVFVIFLYLGIKFIIDAFQEKSKPVCIGIVCLLLIGVATSIDAFSAGISLSLYGNRILKPALLIGSITFINSLLGFWAGGKLKNMPSKLLEILGGSILIILAIKAIL